MSANTSVKRLVGDPRTGMTLSGIQRVSAKDEIAKLDPALAGTLEEYVFDDVFVNCGLDAREMQLCILASLVVQSHTAQLDFQFSAARYAGASLYEIYGAIVHCIPFSGWPKGTSAIAEFGRWLDANQIRFEARTVVGIYGSEKPDFHKLGVRNGRSIYEDYEALEKKLSDMDKDLQRYVTEGVFGRFYGRSDLTLRARQLTAVAILTSLGRLPQLESHIKGAFLVGCSESDVREVIKLMHLYAGWPAVLNALATLNSCL